jgi:hypothetical protein
MQPILLYYANLVLCGVMFVELIMTLKKNPALKLYLLLTIASLIAMNYFAVTGVSNRIQFIIAKFVRFVYVSGTLLALTHLVQQKIPRWLIGLIAFGAVITTGVRIFYYDEINMKALSNVPTHVFTVGAELTTPKAGPRFIILGLAIIAIIIAYHYYRRLLMKLDMESAHYKQLSRWIISLVVPFFLLVIFTIMGNLQMFNEAISSYLFAVFSSASVCSFVLRPRFLDKNVPVQSSGMSTAAKRGPTVVA